MSEANQPVQFPPYGFMVREYAEDIGDGGGAPPEDWHGGDWPTWRGKVLQLLTTTLWPRFDRDKGIWVGAAASSMAAMTNADFVLLEELRATLDTPAGLAAPMTHFELFQLEDEPDAVITLPDTGDGRFTVTHDRSVDRTLREYLRGILPTATVEPVARGYAAQGYRKFGSLDLQLKQELLRPRPYQTALLLKRDWFTHQWAKSAVSPSMISGHAFQGSMAGVAAFYALRQKPSALETLAKHTMGIGDRRVLAGVHYPSDNLSSWITALLLCPLVCPDLDGRTFLWGAIAGHSSVFTAIKATVGESKDHPYRLSLDILESLGTNPDLDVDGALATLTARTPAPAA